MVELKKIMEKKYIKPEIRVEEIELQPMMVASLGENELDIYNKNAESDAMAKWPGSRFNVWGSDEE